MDPKGPLSLGYQTDLAIRALEGSSIDRRSDYWRVGTPANPTFYWGNFLLLDESLLLRDVTVLERLFHEEFPEARHVAIGIDVRGEVREELRKFTASGLDVEANAILAARPSAVTSERLTDAVIRPLASDDDWNQFIDVGMRNREGIYEESAYREYLSAGVPIKRRASRSGRATWLGAFINGQLASHLGIYDCGNGVGRFQLIATAPNFQRRGFASDLVRFASDFAVSNFDSEVLVIAADPNYHAIDLYEHVGFRKTETQIQIQRIAE